MNVSREERKNKKRQTCKLAHMICDQEDLKLYPVAETCCLHLKSICESQTVSHVPLESWSTQRVTVRSYLLWVEIPALSMTPPCHQYNST